MIWATVSSQSCFCCLYRASPYLAANNIINLILVLTIWWCTCVESSLVLLEEGVCYDQCILLEELYYPLPCFIQRRQWQPTPVLLPGKSCGWMSLVGCSPWDMGRVRHDWATSLSLFTFMHWRRKWQPTPVFLPRESQGCRPWGRTESDTTEVT